jgi:hypothetical protein
VKKGYRSAAVYLVAAATLVAMSPSPSTAQPPGGDAAERRRNIRYMEGVLAQAVRVGAEQVGKELERFEPNAVSALLGTPRARGFTIEGHGVFFDVEVPDMDQSIVASLVRSQREQLIGNAADSLRSAIRAMPEGQTMQQVQAALQYLTGTGAMREPAPAAAAVAVPPVPPMIISNPRKVYRTAVIESIVDAMLGYSVQMNIAAEEWLTVAARGVEQSGPLQGLQETTTVTVRVKGADLALYHSDPARRAEIREKVKADVKVF